MYRVIKASRQYIACDEIALRGYMFRAAWKYPNCIDDSEIDDLFKYWNQLDKKDLKKVITAFNHWDNSYSDMTYGRKNSIQEQETYDAAVALGEAIHDALKPIYSGN